MHLDVNAPMFAAGLVTCNDMAAAKRKTNNI